MDIHLRKWINMLKKREFEQFVQEHSDEYCKQMFQIASLFSNSSEQSDDEWRFEMGFTFALHWLGELLGLNLINISEEEKREIDSLL